MAFAASSPKRMMAGGGGYMHDPLSVCVCCVLFMSIKIFFLLVHTCDFMTLIQCNAFIYNITQHLRPYRGNP